MLRRIFSAIAVFLIFSLQAFAQQDARKVLVVVRSGIDDQVGFARALWHIAELKQAGVEVRALFEGEAVLFFLDRGAIQGYLESVRSALAPSPAPQAVAADTGTLTVDTGFSGVPPSSGTYTVDLAAVQASSGAVTPNLINPRRTVDTVKERRRTATPSSPQTAAEAPFMIAGRLKKIAGKHVFGPPEVLKEGEDYFFTLREDFMSAEVPYTLCAFSAAYLRKYEELRKLGRPLSEDRTKPVGLASYIKDNYQVIVY